jgi:hypothetical protein
MDIQQAVTNFCRAMEHCDNIVQVHRAAGSGARGRRSSETSVNRGTVVLAVASWQAFVQDLALAFLETAMADLRAAGPTGLLAAAMDQWCTDFKGAIEKFSTPGVDQTRALLGRAGFDPRPSWTWNQRGGRGQGTLVVKPGDVSKVVDQWLRIRHDIAHGHSTFHPLPVLTAVRDPRSSVKVRQAPNLRLDDAIDCMAFFRSIVRLTAQSAASHIAVLSPTWSSLPVLALGVNVAAI